MSFLAALAARGRTVGDLRLGDPELTMEIDLIGLNGDTGWVSAAWLTPPPELPSLRWLSVSVLINAESDQNLMRSKYYNIVPGGAGERPDRTLSEGA